MPKKKVMEVTESDIDAASPKRTARREVVYTIMVPGLKGTVDINHAKRVLAGLQVAERLMTVDGDVLRVPRLFTIWQGDQLEQVWQQAIKNALPQAIIDVKDWTHAPGYPQGEIGEVSDGNE